MVRYNKKYIGKERGFGGIVEAKEFFVNILHVSSPDLLHDLLNITEHRRIRAGELLVREGERQREFPFLIKGILRGFYLDINGHDITDCFGFCCGTPAMSYNSNRFPSPISIEALSDCELLCLREKAVEEIMKKHPQLLEIYNAMLQNAFQVHWEIKNMICQHSAMERYLWFCKSYPGLVDQVRNKYIASFLGMTPVTLSRLRRTLREENVPEET